MQVLSSGTLDPAIKLWENTRDLLATALQNYLDSCTSLKTELESSPENTKDLVFRIDSAFDSLYLMTKQFTQSTSIILRARNRATSPATNLPKELLSEVFLNVIYAPEHMSLPMQESIEAIYRSLHNILAVCFVWRNVAVTEGQLWQILPASGDHIRRKAINLSLARSGRRLLCLAAKLPTHGPSPFLLDLIKGNVHRFGYLDVKANTMEHIHQILSNIAQAGVPLQLSKLAIHRLMFDTTESYIIAQELPERDTINKMIGSLSSLRLTGVQIDWRSVAFSDRLVEFIIDNFNFQVSDMIIFTLLSTLSTASNLRDLKIRRIRAWHDRNGSRRLDLLKRQYTFPNLRSLVLTGLPSNVLELFLATISPGPYHFTLGLLPWTFEIHCTSSGPKIHTPDDIAVLLSPFGLHHLLLQGDPLEDPSPWLSGSGLRRIIQSMPRLKKLQMRGWNFDAYFCDSFLESDLPFPEIEILELLQTRVSSTIDFKSFLAGVPARTTIFGGYIQTEEDDLIEIKGGDAIIDWLESNVPGFRLADVKDASPKLDSCMWSH